MWAHSDRHGRQRRGIVLVLILGILGLMAVIGVTFATFTGQSRVGARNFAQAMLRPQPNELMDFALSQLIGDTADIRSAIRGHSMARDMYGNDAANNGYLAANPVNGSRFFVTAFQQVAGSNLFDFRTNIPLNDPSLYGYNFTRWVLRITYTGPVPPPPVVGGIGKPVDQTFEIVYDDYTASLNSGFANGFRMFRVSPIDDRTVLSNPTLAALNGLGSANPWFSVPAPPRNSVLLPFTLDGRYLRAFNGPGLQNAAAFANFRYNGFLLGQSSLVGDPNALGMDEDYDACDLENWFLAIQSADGSVIIPSFHRPGILRYDYSAGTTPPASDWNSFNGTGGLDSAARILRPRAFDGHDATTFPDLIPRNDGYIRYDVDNDGDGESDSVWVDLGYPPRRDSRGQLYKPLFAFMVIGLNGRIPLNTAGNIAQGGYTGGPGLGPASHLGNSPSEIDPTYALQNGFDPSGVLYSQIDNAGVDVRLTQLRNLLTGTRPMPNPRSPNPSANGDLNYVLVDGRPFFLPNGQYDATVSAGVPDQVLGADPYGNPAVVRNSEPVPGRWGEAELVPRFILTTQTNWNINATRVRAGLSRAYTPGGAGFPRDANDDNFNTFDPFPFQRNRGAGQVGEILDQDLYDPSGGLLLPVERIRRFVTPIDLNGTGRVVPFNGGNPPPNLRGGDDLGRVGFLSYFRPPGLPGIINNSATYYGAIGSLPPSTGVTGVNRAANDLAVDNTNNPTHGYDFYRFPRASNPWQIGGMPFNRGNGQRIPTYDHEVNGRRRTDGLDDADEMMLYQPNGIDEPFGPGDLEWLYRKQDVDGNQLASRLSVLAPVSFADISDPGTSVNFLHGLRHRRLFSTDSWELNNYAWTNDNPGGVFSQNSRFHPAANADLANLNVPGNVIFPTSPAFATYPWAQFLGPFLFNQTPPQSPTNFASAITPDPVPTWPVPGPSIAHRGKRINLNFPLPVSNDPHEPIRRKWISETYQFLKAVLPPKAVDTPEELAQLSQFLVNVVDFRDPDGTMTIFVNPDVVIVPGTVSGGPPATTATPHTLAFAPGPGSALPLRQFGMEYNPVAINEVLAYSFPRKEGGDKVVTNRFFVEFVNTLTQAAVGTAATLNLNGWDLVVTGDDPVSRPDPYSGQLLPILEANYFGLIPLAAQASGQPVFSNAGFGYPSQNVTLIPLATGGVPNPAMGSPPLNFYYVVGNLIANNLNATRLAENYPPLSSGNFSVPGWNGASMIQSLAPPFDPTNTTAPPPGVPPTPAPGYDPSVATSKPNTYPAKSGILTAPAKNSQNYFWLCLRRPANLFRAPDPNPSSPTYNPMVVVDCMRFPLIESGGDVTNIDPMDDSKDTITPGTNAIYSVQRTQPYRGAHAVSSAIGATTLDTRYGFSEQMSQPINQPNSGGGFQFGIFRSNSSTPPNQGRITSFLYHTLGAPNDNQEPWDYFPFNDRDFTSVGELLLVPGCPPGLFTKWFAELPPSATFPRSVPPGTGSNLVPRAAVPVPPNAALAFPTGTPIPPHTYPYLVDKFFYTGASDGSPPQSVDGPSGAGWFKMLEFLEVPTTAQGGIGPVAEGANFDWARQDFRPGLLNLNLIIDEEVFLALLGQHDANFNETLLNATVLPPPRPPGIPLPATRRPRVVTGVDRAGTPLLPNTGVSPPVPSGSHEIPEAGYFYGSISSVKAAFAQFLKMRHGGSGFLFAYGSGATGTPNPAGVPPDVSVAAERPFRSLSFPDINYTVMRPATLPPSPYTNPAGPSASVRDPGLKNPTLYPAYPTGTIPTNPVPPAIPARRLFQPPDAFATSNASEVGDPFINRQTQTGSMGGLTNSRVNLVSPVPLPPATENPYLGSNNDRGQHPYYRSEMIQRVLNLTTVRTHQYAVWITVGFFKVLRQGDPTLAVSHPAFAYDLLGPEIGLDSGKPIRHRAFFIVDRSKLIGFDPASPGSYREAVLYRRLIQ